MPMKNHLAAQYPDAKLAAHSARFEARSARPVGQIAGAALKPAEQDERPIPYFLRLKK
jgi:hypothetical protein